MIGPPNEAWVDVNSVATYALIDMGVKIATIVHSSVRQLQLVHNLNEVIWVEGTGDFIVPYLGYAEVNLQIPQFPQYEMIFILVIPDS